MSYLLSRSIFFFSGNIRVFKCLRPKWPQGSERFARQKHICFAAAAEVVVTGSQPVRMSPYNSCGTLSEPESTSKTALLCLSRHGRFKAKVKQKVHPNIDSNWHRENSWRCSYRCWVASWACNQCPLGQWEGSPLKNFDEFVFDELQRLLRKADRHRKTMI